MINYAALPLRYILCIDVKSFFASVEAARRGYDPMETFLVVISDLKRQGSIVLASTPPMKKVFGIKTAHRLYEIPKDPRIIMVEPSMGLYIDVNRDIHRIFQQYAADEDILTYSIDESFLDVTATAHLFGNPMEIAIQIRDQILRELGLPVTIGIGDNPLLAKLALDHEAKTRPSQIACWHYEDVPHTLWKIKDLRSFWGISKGYERRLLQLGIESIYDLAHFPKEILHKKLGILGLQLYYHAHGVDYSRLSERSLPKNQGYSKSQVLMRDYEHLDEILIVMSEMVEQLAIRMRAHNKRCLGIHLSVGGSHFEPDSGFHVSRRLKAPTHQTEELIKQFTDLFLEHWSSKVIRTLDVSCHPLISDQYQQSSFLENDEDRRRRRLQETLDLIRDRYGSGSIFKAHSLEEGSTFFERIQQVGGHKAHTELSHEMETTQRLRQK